MDSVDDPLFAATASSDTPLDEEKNGLLSSTHVVRYLDLLIAMYIDIYIYTIIYTYMI